MISSSLVKIYYQEGLYESNDIKSVCGVVLHKDHSSITVGILDRQIIFNWQNIIKIETVKNNRGLPSFYKIIARHCNK